MIPDWTPLDAEMARWDRGGLSLPLWWRDDDAVSRTPALDRLADLSERIGLSVHLAVVPAGAGPSLVRAVEDHACLFPVVHGWAHANHAPEGAKKAEFGADRSVPILLAEATKGLIRLSDLFGDRCAPMFVPPWNRIAPDVVPMLAGAGYSALSTFTPRKAAQAAPGLSQVNTHLDPIAWKAGRGLVAPDLLIAQVARQLADRREGRADNAEPYGILTHHLVHDDDIWSFAAALLGRLLSGPAHPWTTDERTQPK